METIAHHDTASGVALGKDIRHCPHALKGGPAGVIGENLAGCHALLDEVIASHAGLGEDPVPSASSGRHNEGSQALLFKIESVVEPGFEDGRRLAGVLGRAEDDDGIGG